MRTVMLLLALGCTTAAAMAAEPAAAATPVTGPIGGFFPTYKCSLGFTGPRKQLVSTTGNPGPAPAIPNYTCVGPQPVCEANLWPGNLRVEDGKFKYDCGQPPG